jgi:hypothetical protein
VRRKGDEAPHSTNEINATVNVNSYIWQPWFATVDGNLSISMLNDSGSTGSEAESTTAAGGFTLGMLPLSQYPTSLSYARTDTRVNGDFISSELVRDRFNITSHVLLPWEVRSMLSATYESTDQPGFGTEERHQAQMSFDKGFNTTFVSLNLQFDDADFDSEKTDSAREQNALAVLRYNTQFLTDITSQSTTTVRFGQEETLPADGILRTLDTYSIQGISTALWRPKDRPFTVTGAFRTLTETLDFGGSGSSPSTETQLAALTAGLNYPITQRLTATAGTTADVNSVSRGAGGLTGELPDTSTTSAGTSLSGGLNYLSPPEPLAGFDWRWNASGRARAAQRTDNGFNEEESTSVGHSFQRDFVLPILKTVTFLANQDGSVARNSASDTGIAPVVSHRVSLSRNSVEATKRTFMSAALSDRRSIISDEPDEFQIAQILVTRLSQIDLESDWRANLSLQWTRQQLGKNSAATTTSANGTMDYRKINLFDLENLVFRSELTLNAIGLREAVNDTERNRGFADNLRGDWRNRLEYRIGRVVTSLEGRVFYDQDDIGAAVVWRVRRDFADVF